MSLSTTDTLCPKLRALDLQTIIHDGQPSILLRDPWQLAEQMVIIPQQLAPVLMLCDGTRDVDGLAASLAIRYGLRANPDMLRHLVGALDESFLLENDRFDQAWQAALAAYRQAPVRPLALAGRSYPADPDQLRPLLDGYLEAAGDVPATEARGLVCPHIDYARGGPVYAQIWKSVQETVRGADLVILLGTDHLGDGGVVTLTRQHYGTPFGTLPTAQDVVDPLIEAIGEEEALGGELSHRNEHSIELAAVWLHHIRQGAPCELVPILCGSFAPFVQDRVELENDPTITCLVEMLHQTIGDRRTLVVAAADLSHVGPAFGGPPVDPVGQAMLKTADQQLIDAVCAGDAQGFFEVIHRERDRHNVCGLPPIYAALRILDPVSGTAIAYDRCLADRQGTSLVSICGITLE